MNIFLPATVFTLIAIMCMTPCGAMAQGKAFNGVEAGFERAFAHEKAGSFMEAVLEYEAILQKAPENRLAQKRRLLALSALGAKSYALDEALRTLPDDRELLDALKGDAAVERIRWEEYEDAIGILSEGRGDGENHRARFDTIFALVKAREMEKAVEEYEKMRAQGLDAPWFVHEQLAEAYIYLGKPREALSAAESAGKSGPDSYKIGLLKVNAFWEMAMWREAARELEGLLARSSPVIHTDRPEANWEYLEIAETKGWLMAFEERYGEAQDYFLELHGKAPGNAGIRTGLAHVYLWRGWPRKALKEFRIIESMGPDEATAVNALTGKAAALHASGFRVEAAALATELQRSYPKDKNVRDLVRKLEAERKPGVYADFLAVNEDDGTSEIQAGAEASVPVTLKASVLGHFFWKKSSSEDSEAYFRRAGVGAVYHATPSLKVTERLTVDYQDGNDFGSYTLVELEPDDHWRFGLLYDSFTTEVPMRARAFGVESNRLEARAGYRVSEGASASLTAARQKFSDDNERYEGVLSLEGGLYAGGGLISRALLDVYGSRNSLEDAPYFNPSHDLSVALTFMAEHTLRRVAERTYLHRLFLTAGGYRQSGFDIEPIGSVRYEQEYRFSQTRAAVVGGSLTRQVYDGEDVDGYAVYLSYRGSF